MEQLAGIGMNRSVAQRAEAAPDGLLVAVEVARVPLDRLAHRADLGLYRGDALAAVLLSQHRLERVQVLSPGREVRAGPEGVEERRPTLVPADLLDDAGDRTDQVL